MRLEPIWWMDDLAEAEDRRRDLARQERKAKRPRLRDRVRITRGKFVGREGYIAADNWLWYVVVFTDRGFEHQSIKPI